MPEELTASLNTKNEISHLEQFMSGHVFGLESPHPYVHGVDAERVARHMFERQASTYEADPTLVEVAWLDDDIRNFWVAEATSVLIYIASISA